MITFRIVNDDHAQDCLKCFSKLVDIYNQGDKLAERGELILQSDLKKKVKNIGTQTEIRELKTLPDQIQYTVPRQKTITNFFTKKPKSSSTVPSIIIN